MKQKKHTFFLMAFLGALIFFGLLSFCLFLFILVIPTSGGMGGYVGVPFTISEGEGVNIISRNLYAKGLIRSKFVFETYVWLLRSERKIIAGDYEFDRGHDDIISLSNKLFRGPEPRDRFITIIEGWDRRKIAHYLEKEGFVSSTEFLEKTKDLEGYLFPDTYRVFSDATEEEIIGKMLDNFHKKVDEKLIQEIKDQGKTIEQILIVASIVEAEVRTEEDRKNVADIFWKRLKADMPLQSDATINFLTRSGRDRSTLADLEIESPYNTYKYAGLPPGPINSPSLESILAVIFPLKNSYYYFLTDAEGKVYYARSFEEHNLNRSKYLK